MNRTSNHAFVNHLLVYTLVMICFTGSIGLGTVWMRHQISLTANATKVLDARIAEMERRVNETTAVMEAEQDPAVLKRRNSEWRLGLVQPAPEQVVRVAGDPVMRLAAKRDRALYTDLARPATVSLRLAGLTP
ncbi:MAG: hypothetical protein JWM88_1780 [Verrucomicrobia bacterium]|nr:hypothetical protein [Verrucomicrobiota bacterium]